MENDKNLDHIISTSEGELYIDTSEFFKRPKVQETIKKLLASDIVKKFRKKRKNKK
jgi:hypothetical protein